MAAWESLFTPGNITGQQDSCFFLNDVGNDILKFDEVTKLVSIDNLKAAKLNFTIITQTYKMAHKNIEELEKKLNVLHAKTLHIGLMKTTIEKQGIMFKLNNELMLDEIMKPEKYTELHTSLIKAENDILRNIDLKQSQYKSDFSNITSEIKENYNIIEEIEKIIKFIKNDINIEELKVTPAVVSTVECGICKSAQVDHVLRNCGHTFCKGCVDSLKEKCVYCNTLITDYGAGSKALRIYFSS
jgi:hypothetical protein